MLSFDIEEEEEADTAPKRPKLKKDPDTDTSFLPDKYVRLTCEQLLGALFVVVVVVVAVVVDVCPVLVA